MIHQLGQNIWHLCEYMVITLPWEKFDFVTSN